MLAAWKGFLAAGEPASVPWVPPPPAGSREGTLMIEKIQDKYYGIMAKATCLRAQGAKGQTLIEYALLGALLAVGLVAATIALRTQIEGVFTAISNAMSNAIDHGMH